MFSEDDNVIEDKIIDYNDKGIDCYVWHEELKDLYLIQNKYYDDNSSIDTNYVFNDFLTRSIGSLEKETYNRSKELQKIYSKYKNDEDFTVFFHLYVTNNNKDSKLDEKVKKFNRENTNQEVKIFYLEDISEQYFKEPKIDKKDMVATIGTINKGTLLNIDTLHYGMNQTLDARYSLTPVTVLYDLYQESKRQSYPIFNDNIREYLGSKGTTNKNIKKTLADVQDRKNFFYYNNGITVICEDITAIDTGLNAIEGCNAYFKVKNPQIVNGCQTVSTINEVLDQYPDSTRSKEFKDTYVMVKFLKIHDRDNTLYEQIVRFNNSQNSIDEKTFAANKKEFIRLQTEFERRGFLLAIKQSDNYKFNQKYSKPTELLNRSKELLDKFNLQYKNVKDFIIPLEKLLQVFLAFKSGAQQAFQKKSQLLVNKSSQYETVLNLIKNPNFTINQMLDLYLFYALCESKKKSSEDKKIPIPFYVIDAINKYECKDEMETINVLFNNKESIRKLLNIYASATSFYYETMKSKGIEYNTMIKAEVDYAQFETSINTAKRVASINQW